MRRVLPILCCLSVACVGPGVDPDDTDESDVVVETDETDLGLETDEPGETDEAYAAPVCGGEEVVVRVPTADGEALVADWHPAEAEGAPAIVLLHDQGADRSAFPARVRAALHAEGVAVLNLDRRGHGASTGDAGAALDGAGALSDAEAAVRFLLSAESGCAVDPASVVLMGAGAGTAPTFDYLRLRDTALPAPAALVWMSPDEATTTNQATLTEIVLEDRASVSLPMLWFFGADEAFSNLYITADVPGAWNFVEVPAFTGSDWFDGAEVEEDTLAALETFLGETLAGDEEPDPPEDTDVSDAVPPQEADSDNDTYYSAMFSVNFQPSNAPSRFVAADDISSPTGDDQDWIAFRTAAPAGSQIGYDITLACNHTAVAGYVRAELWDAETSPPEPIQGYTVSCATGSATWSGLEVAHDYLVKVHWDGLPTQDLTYSTWEVCLAASASGWCP